MDLVRILFFVKDFFRNFCDVCGRMTPDNQIFTFFSSNDFVLDIINVERCWKYSYRQSR